MTSDITITNATIAASTLPLRDTYLVDVFEVHDDVLGECGRKKRLHVRQSVFAFRGARRPVEGEYEISEAGSHLRGTADTTDNDVLHDRNLDLDRNLLAASLGPIVTHREDVIPHRNSRRLDEGCDTTDDTLRGKSLVRVRVVFEDHRRQLRHIMCFQNPRVDSLTE